MSNSKIDTLEPGRELDALVAEWVMGQKVSRVAGETYWAEYTGSADTLVRRCPKFYSTDIAAAWEVVKKIRSIESWPAGSKKDFLIEQTDRLEEGKWVVRMNGFPSATSGSNFSNVYAIADTAPHTICLAALKAVESQP